MTVPKFEHPHCHGVRHSHDSRLRGVPGRDPLLRPTGASPFFLLVYPLHGCDGTFAIHSRRNDSEPQCGRRQHVGRLHSIGPGSSTRRSANGWLTRGSSSPSSDIPEIRNRVSHNRGLPHQPAEDPDHHGFTYFIPRYLGHAGGPDHQCRQVPFPSPGASWEDSSFLSSGLSASFFPPSCADT